MRIYGLRYGVAVLGCAVLLACVAPAAAETIALKAELKGANEVPPNQSKASGSVALTYDTANKKLTWKGTFSGLSAAPTMTHFHGPGEPTKNAGVALAIPNPGLAGIEGSATLTDAQAAALLSGQWYVNIHTAAYPPGEIRGQVVK